MNTRFAPFLAKWWVTLFASFFGEISVPFTTWSAIASWLSCRSTTPTRRCLCWQLTAGPTFPTSYLDRAVLHVLPPRRKNQAFKLVLVKCELFELTQLCFLFLFGSVCCLLATFLNTATSCLLVALAIVCNWELATPTLGYLRFRAYVNHDPLVNNGRVSVLYKFGVTDSSSSKWVVPVSYALSPATAASHVIFSPF